MKLELSKEWFEQNLPRGGEEVQACNPAGLACDRSKVRPSGSPSTENSAVAHRVIAWFIKLFQWTVSSRPINSPTRPESTSKN